MTNKSTRTMTMTFWEHSHRAFPETCDLWDNRSELWWDMTWPTKRQWHDEHKGQRQRQWHLESTLSEWPLRLVTFETFDQSDEDTWPDQQKDKDKDIERVSWKRFVTLETLITFMKIDNKCTNIHSILWIKSDRNSIHNSSDAFGSGDNKMFLTACDNVLIYTSEFDSQQQVVKGD